MLLWGMGMVISMYHIVLTLGVDIIFTFNLKNVSY